MPHFPFNRVLTRPIQYLTHTPLGRFLRLFSPGTLKYALLGAALIFSFGASVVWAKETLPSFEPRLSFEEFEKELALGKQSEDLCAWERDLGFFLSRERGQENSDRIDCIDRLGGDNPESMLGEMKDEFKAPDVLLAEEIQALVAGFPIEVMTGPIAEYDREIAGLIVGIGKKESNWGKRTPKLGGEECFNFWGYRGAGTRGFTPDGYGCWEKPAEAVKTIGDRLAKLRDLRQSAEPARMIVWKCGHSCAGHSDESVRKWIADVNFYYQEIAKN